MCIVYFITSIQEGLGKKPAFYSLGVLIAFREMLVNDTQESHR